LLKKIALEEAVGKELSHDITEIRPGEFKGPAFQKGHKICDEDLCHLQRLGKNHLYLIDLEKDEIHENEAATILAGALAGDGVTWDRKPREGKINLYAERDGLLFINTAALAAFNMVDEVMCATLHNHSLVRKRDKIAATRAIPLVMRRISIERAKTIAQHDAPVISVRPLRPAKVGIIVTGNEVYNGLIEDRFAPILKTKAVTLGCIPKMVEFAPDDASLLSGKIRSQLSLGCELIILSGGMSVDPDDVTGESIRRAGASEFYYGASALPGAMFMVAYIGDVPLLGVPACGLFHRTTVLDLILPRILAGEHITKADLAFLGHGGLCRECPECHYPNCTFGKGM